MSVPMRVESGLFTDLEKEPSPETAVYRIYDEAGGLLYVGITSNIEMRWRDHAMAKSWWRTEAFRYEVRWYPTRDLAAAEEQRAIQHEHPKRNKIHVVLPRKDVSVRVPGTFSMGEIARRFRISPDTLRVMANQPDFPKRLTDLPVPYRRGKRYPAPDVEAYFARLRPPAE